tara:strand:- start:364 stop:639 length:276 start_codon:yes stop_codon:yes gene_type:complete
MTRTLSTTFLQALELGQNILVKSKFNDRWLSFQGVPLSEEINESTQVLILKGNGYVGNGKDWMTLERAGQDLEMYAANTKGWEVAKPWQIK